MVGQMDQRTRVRVERGYFMLRTDGRPENIMPPAPKGGGIKIDRHLNGRLKCINPVVLEYIKQKNIVKINKQWKISKKFG